MTDPSTPVYVKSVTFRTAAVAHSGSATTLALVQNTSVDIWDAQDLLADGSPTTTITPSSGNGFGFIASDGTSFYVTESTSFSAFSIDVLSPQTAGSTTYSKSKFGFSIACAPSGIDVGDGRIFVSGLDSQLHSSHWLFSLAGGVPSLATPRYEGCSAADTLAQCNYFSNTYGHIQSVAFAANGGRHFLIVGAYSIGDVYELGDVTLPRSIIAFQVPYLTVPEDVGTARIPVVRTGDTTGLQSIHYDVTGDTATAGADFTPVSGNLTFSPGETEEMIDVPIVFDDVSEPTETVHVTLSQPNGGATREGDGYYVLSIENVDPLPELSMGSAALSVAENAGTANIVVTRTGSTAADVSIDYHTVDGTAIAGQDYEATSARYCAGTKVGSWVRLSTTEL